MPRKSPDRVVEHRLSLQDAEREAIIPILSDIKTMTQAGENVVRLAELKAYALIGVGSVAALGAVFYAPRIWAQTTAAINGVQDITESLTGPIDFLTDAWNAGANTGPVLWVRDLFGFGPTDP